MFLVFFVNINAFLVRKCFDILLTRPTQWGRAETYQGLQHDRAVIGACYLPQTRLCFMSHSSARSWRGSPLLSSSDVIWWKFTLKVFSNCALLCFYHFYLVKLFQKNDFLSCGRFFGLQYLNLIFDNAAPSSRTLLDRVSDIKTRL